jgi:hypothetical protein
MLFRTEATQNVLSSDKIAEEKTGAELGQHPAGATWQTTSSHMGVKQKVTQCIPWAMTFGI